MQIQRKTTWIECDVQVHPYLTYADVVAPLAFNNRCVVIDVQDVDGEGVICVSWRWATVDGTHL